MARRILLQELRRASSRWWLRYNVARQPKKRARARSVIETAGRALSSCPLQAPFLGQAHLGDALGLVADVTLNPSWIPAVGFLVASL